MNILHIKQLPYYRRCLFSVLELHVRYSWQVLIPNMHHNLLLICHLHALTCITWNYRLCTDVLHILNDYQRHCLCGLEFHEGSNWRPTAPDTYWSFSDTALCPYIAIPYIHHYLVHYCTWQQSSCTLWLYYTPNDGFTSNDALFYMNKVILNGLLADAVHSIYLHVHVAVSFPITMDTINVWKLILKLKEVPYHTSW